MKIRELETFEYFGDCGHPKLEICTYGKCENCHMADIESTIVFTVATTNKMARS